MIDPAVERQYADTRELLALWNTFHQFFNMGVKGESITPEKENQFLEIKSRIAMLHDSFMEALSANQNVGQEVLNIITRAITLKHLGRLSTADTKKMEIEWHESYLLLNDTIAALDEKRKELALINETQYKASQAGAAARQKAGKFFGSFYFKLAAIIAVLLGATIGVQVFGFYDYDELGKIGALKTPFSWGKAVVRKVYNEDSPWPDVELARRRNHSGWPEGVKAPTVDSNSKEDAVKKIATYTMPIGLAPRLVPELNKAVQAKVEKAEKPGQADIEIYTLRFNNADEAKAVEKLWDDTVTAFNSRNTQLPETFNKLGIIRDVNIITFIYTDRRETLDRMVIEVYYKKA